MIPSTEFTVIEFLIWCFMWAVFGFWLGVGVEAEKEIERKERERRR
jgi:hypothetical protein